MCTLNKKIYPYIFVFDNMTWWMKVFDKCSRSSLAMVALLSLHIFFNVHKSKYIMQRTLFVIMHLNHFHFTRNYKTEQLSHLSQNAFRIHSYQPYRDNRSWSAHFEIYWIHPQHDLSMNNKLIFVDLTTAFTFTCSIRVNFLLLLTVTLRTFHIFHSNNNHI